MAIERKKGIRTPDTIPTTFPLPPGTAFFVGDPGSEFSGEEWQTQGNVVFVRLPLPPISTLSQGIFVSGKFRDENFKDLPDTHPDAQWNGWQVFVRPPKE